MVVEKNSCYFWYKKYEAICEVYFLSVTGREKIIEIRSCEGKKELRLSIENNSCHQITVYNGLSEET